MNDLVALITLSTDERTKREAQRGTNRIKPWFDFSACGVRVRYRVKGTVLPTFTSADPLGIFATLQACHPLRKLPSFVHFPASSGTAIQFSANLFLTMSR